MSSFWRNRWDDIRGNLIWQLLVWLCGGGLLTVLIQTARSAANLPFEWRFVGVVFVICVLSLAVIMLFAERQRTPLQSTVQTGGIIPPMQPAVNFDAANHLRISYQSNVTAEGEKNIKLAAAQNQPDDQVGFLAKLIGIGLVSYMHDITWAYIYKSQILMLMELNRRNGLMPVLDTKPYYDEAARDYPQIYANYSFDQWLGFVQEQQLVIRHPSDMLEITHKGKDFLKYSIHWGRYPEARKG